jgi:hypothetical protein
MGRVLDALHVSMYCGDGTGCEPYVDYRDAQGELLVCLTSDVDQRHDHSCTVEFACNHKGGVDVEHGDQGCRPHSD